MLFQIMFFIWIFLLFYVVKKNVPDWKAVLQCVPFRADKRERTSDKTGKNNFVHMSLPASSYAGSIRPGIENNIHRRCMHRQAQRNG